jgi:hypothetical protein
MIYGIQISPSGRAKCKRCGKPIGIGTPRGVELSYHNNHSEECYFCYECLPPKIEADIKVCEADIEKLRELNKELEIKINENPQGIVLSKLR